MNYPWTPEIDANLRQWRADRVPMEVIGERLGVSRGAVAGRCWFLGLCKPIKRRAGVVAAPIATLAPSPPVSPVLVRLAPFDPLARALVEGRTVHHGEAA